MSARSFGHYVSLGMLAAALMGCEGEGDKSSQLVVLYRDSVAPGNSIVNLVSHNDPSGWKANIYCEELRQLFQAKEKRPFHCSMAVFNEYRPTIKAR